MTDIPVTDLLTTAEEAADAAAAIARAGHEHLLAGKRLEVRVKGSVMDPVSEVDIAAQKEVIRMISTRFPEHRFLAEEEGADGMGDKASPYVWVIDPIDGTRNFIRGKPNFGSIVAVEKNGELLAGCMVLPMLGQRFSAAKGKGAFANGEPVKLRKTLNMEDATVCSNVTRRAEKDANGVLRFAIPPSGSVENYSCAAQALGDILMGWNDAIVSRGIKRWDVAAGLLMISEAGGKYRCEWTDPKDPRSSIVCVASTAEIFDELCDFAFEQKLA